MGAGFAHEQQRVRMDRRESPRREVNSAVETDHRPHLRGHRGGAKQRRGSRRSVREHPQWQLAQSVVRANPAQQRDRAALQKLLIEMEPAGMTVLVLFDRCQQIDMSSQEAPELQASGDMVVERCNERVVTAAQEHDQPSRGSGASYSYVELDLPFLTVRDDSFP